MGKIVRNNPTAKIGKERLKILRMELPLSSLPYFLSEYHVDMPTINRKKGKTRSVGVHPFHLNAQENKHNPNTRIIYYNHKSYCYSPEDIQ